MSARETILARIRARQGRSGAASADEKSAVDTYIAARAAGPRPSSEWKCVERFSERALSLATTVDHVGALAEVPRAIAKYLEQNRLTRSIVCWPDLIELEWSAARLNAEARAAEEPDMIGVTGAYCAIAETGTLMLLSGARMPSSTSLLPETHIAIVHADRIVRGMEDAWSLLRSEVGALPRAVNFISGPSRTADIEQTLVLGAHGPYRVHVVLVRGEE